MISTRLTNEIQYSDSTCWQLSEAVSWLFNVRHRVASYAGIVVAIEDSLRKLAGLSYLTGLPGRLRLNPNRETF